MNLFDYALIFLFILFLLLPWFLAYLELKGEEDKEGILIIQRKGRRALLFASILGVFMWIADPPSSGDYDYFSGFGFILIGLILNSIIFIIKGLFCLRFAKERTIQRINRKKWAEKP